MDIGSRRDRSQLISEVLIQCTKPSIMTHVMYRISSNYSGTMNFLNYLQKKQMLILNDDKYETTEKGIYFLKKYSELQKILES